MARGGLHRQILLVAIGPSSRPRPRAPLLRRSGRDTTTVAAAVRRFARLRPFPYIPRARAPDRKREGAASRRRSMPAALRARAACAILLVIALAAGCGKKEAPPVARGP